MRGAIYVNDADVADKKYHSLIEVENKLLINYADTTSAV